MTARFSERVGNAAEALFSHATFGLAARCVAINTEMADAHNLPVSWTSYRRQDVGVLPKPPFFEIYTGGTRPTDLPVAGSNEFDVDVAIKAWLSQAEVHGDPDRGQRLYERLERAFWEILIERVRYGGHTLNDAADGRINNLRNMTVEPMIMWDADMEQQGGIGALTQFTITVAEEDTV